MRAVLRSEGSQRAVGAFTLWFAIISAHAALGCTKLGHLPAAPDAPLEPIGVEQTAIERSEICVGSSVASVGELGESLYYRAALLPDGKLVVGYFAFFSEERPWGNNWLTWTVVPALAVDLFYTRAAFVAPGLQRAMSGKGDVEGFRVVYDLQPDGTLRVESAVADDGSHDPVQLSAADVMSIDPKRPTFYSDVWSHQLGGRGIRSKSDLDYVHCYGAGHLHPLPDSIVSDFQLAGRAPPAHVEALGGQVVPATAQAQAKALVVPPPPL